MTEAERKKLLVELESDFRRAETGLAIAQAEYEKAYAAMWQYTEEQGGGRKRALVFSPDVTMN